MLNSSITSNLEKLSQKSILDNGVALWGIGGQTQEMISWLKGKGIAVRFIVDNFKYTFGSEYEGIPVIQAKELVTKGTDISFLLATNHNQAIRKQLAAYGVQRIYNLYNLEEKESSDTCVIPYHFKDRSRGKRALCYILAGYDPGLWDNVLTRINKFSSEDIDYCLVTSGKCSKELERIAEEYNWSYLWTEKNQVCYIQNLVIELHPEAELLIKMDEDIFIGKHFFEGMLQAYNDLEKNGDYRVGFLAPVIPLNCSGYLSYLKLIRQKELFEEKFGRAYRSRFSAVFSLPDAAKFLWESMGSFDEMEDKFFQNVNYEMCNSYFNIGCILYTREKWLMMGKWPCNENETGMGIDERYIMKDNFDKDMVIYEVQNVLVGHLAFGPQKQEMYQFYRERPEVFQIMENI